MAPNVPIDGIPTISAMPNLRTIRTAAQPGLRLAIAKPWVRGSVLSTLSDAIGVFFLDY
jgi:hypothetical protein